MFDLKQKNNFNLEKATYILEMLCYTKNDILLQQKFCRCQSLIQIKL